MFSMPPAMAASTWPSQYLLRSRGDRLRARAADAIDRHRGHGDGNAAVERRLPGRVHAVAGLDDVAHHHAADARGSMPERRSVSRTTAAPSSVAGVPSTCRYKFRSRCERGDTGRRLAMALECPSISVVERSGFADLPPDAH